MDIFFENILQKLKKKNLIKRIVTLFISLLVLAFVYNILLLPTGLVVGGINGIAIITNYVYEIDSSIMIFLISTVCLLFSFMYLDIEKTVGSILATFIYPILVEELGLIIGILVLIGYGYMLYRILKIAKSADCIRNAVICYGAFMLILLHLLVNFLGTLALIPLTGVPLPFLSYGGSFNMNCSRK